MVLIENYRHAKSPLDSSSIVSLCEEEDTIFIDEIKKEVKIAKLFLLCNSTGTRFSNKEIEEENRNRINEVLRKRRINPNK